VITYCGFALQFKGHPVPNTVTMHWVNTFRIPLEWNSIYH
jgi:hypothetical protein